MRLDTCSLPCPMSTYREHVAAHLALGYQRHRAVGHAHGPYCSDKGNSHLRDRMLSDDRLGLVDLSACAVHPLEDREDSRRPVNINGPRLVVQGESGERLTTSSATALSK
jgi:hypothetical protein